MKTQVKLNLDWAFAAVLENEQTLLIAALKPGVATWVNETLPILQKRLRKARDGTQSTMATRTDNDAGVWIFNAMIHNRDIGTDIIAMVAPTEDGVKIMSDAFMQAVETRMGRPSSTMHY